MKLCEAGAGHTAACESLACSYPPLLQLKPGIGSHASCIIASIHTDLCMRWGATTQQSMLDWEFMGSSPSRRSNEDSSKRFACACCCESIRSGQPQGQPSRPELDRGPGSATKVRVWLDKVAYALATLQLLAMLHLHDKQWILFHPEILHHSHL